MCTQICEGMSGGINTHRVSKLRTSNKSGIMVADWKPESKTQSLEDGHIYCIVLILNSFLSHV